MQSAEAKQIWDQIEILRASSKEQGENLSAVNEWRRWADEKLKMVCQQITYWIWRLVLLAAFSGGAGSFAFDWIG